jgi:hypothetical protein
MNADIEIMMNEFSRLDELLDNEGHNDACRDCDFYSEWTEYHEPGMPGEPMAECTVEDEEQCPRLKGK